MNEILLEIINRYGITTAAVVFILKTIFDIFRGQTTKYIKAIEANTVAIDKLRQDLQVAFLNIKQLRDKSGLGPISKIEMDQ